MQLFQPALTDGFPIDMRVDSIQQRAHEMLMRDMMVGGVGEAMKGVTLRIQVKVDRQTLLLITSSSIIWQSSGTIYLG